MWNSMIFDQFDFELRSYLERSRVEQAHESGRVKGFIEGLQAAKLPPKEQIKLLETLRDSL